MIEAYDSEGEESEGVESGDETEESERQQTEVTPRGTNNHLLVTNSKRSVKVIIFVKRLLFIVSERHFKFSVFDIKLSCMQFVRFSKEQYLVQYI